jgi:hypothetical protein
VVHPQTENDHEHQQHVPINMRPRNAGIARAAAVARAEIHDVHSGTSLMASASATV